MLRTLNTLGPLFNSNGSEPNRSVLPLRPLGLPLLDCEMVRRGAAIFGGGATANSRRSPRLVKVNDEDMVNKLT